MTKFEQGILIIGMHLLYILVEGLFGMKGQYQNTKDRMHKGIAAVVALINEE